MGNFCSCSDNDKIIEQAYQQRTRQKYCSICNEKMKEQQYTMYYGICKWCRAFPDKVDNYIEERSDELDERASGVLSEEEEEVN